VAAAQALAYGRQQGGAVRSAAAITRGALTTAWVVTAPRIDVLRPDLAIRDRNATHERHGTSHPLSLNAAVDVRRRRLTRTHPTRRRRRGRLSDPVGFDAGDLEEGEPADCDSFSAEDV
jgi:hypothetical protein